MNQNQDTNPRKPKTILILSIITSLFMGVMGYEIATKAPIKSQRESSSSQKFVILNKQQPSVLLNDQKKYASLNAQNQHLTNKVIALKEHALDLSRRLQTVQLSVFAARKTHDQNIIDQLQATLQEKEHLNSQLQEDYAKLQQNLEVQDQHAMTMETTIDHLSEMVELQRKSKENTIEGLKTHFEVAGAAEKNRLMNIIQDLENHQVKLQKDLEQQSTEIARLEESLTQSNFFAAENEQALIFAVLQHEEKQKELVAKAENLTTLLNLEEIAVQSLQSEISAIEESERQQTVALQEELKLNTMQRIHESMMHEDLSHLLEADIHQKQAELNVALANLNRAEALINEQNNNIALLKEQRDQREKELIQEQDVLLADLAQKQENLSLALSKFNSSEISLIEQNEEIENLKNQIIQKETDLAQIRSMASEQLILNDHLAAQMLQKQDELNEALAKFDRADMSIIEQHQELVTLKDQIVQREHELAEVREIATEKMKANQQLIAEMEQKQKELAEISTQFAQTEIALNSHQEQIASLKEQMAQREEEFTQINAALLADIVLKEENLELARQKFDGSESNLNAQIIEIAALKEQINQHQQDLIKTRELYNSELNSKETLIAEMSLKQDALNANAALLAQQEIAAIKEQMAEREQELVQINAALVADMAQKETDLSLMLAELEGFKSSQNEQTQEIATLKEQINSKEQELVQLQNLTAAEMQKNQQLIAEMTQKQEELTLALSQINQSELSFTEKQQEIAALKEQMTQREQELVQLNTALVADMAQKETDLSFMLAELEAFKSSQNEQTQEIATLKEQINSKEQELVQFQELTATEMQKNQQLIADMAQKQEDLELALSQINQSELSVTEKQQEIAALKEQMTQREQELVQINAALVADMAQKETDLSLMLAELEGFKSSQNEQTQEIATLKEQINSKEQELVQFQELTAAEMQKNQQLIADMTQKQEELTDTIAQFHNLEAQIQAQHQEVMTQKEQMIQREQELMQVNETLLTDIAQKEENLALTLIKFESAEARLREQNEAITTLNEKIQLQEQNLAQAVELTSEEQKVREQLTADISEKQEQLAITTAQLTQAETSINGQLQEIMSLKEQLTVREQELTQINATLIADIVQKEENLALALSQFDNSETSLKEQNQTIAALKEQIVKQEQDVAQIREIALEEAKAHQQLLAEISQKQEELNAILAQKTQAEISLTQQHHEIVTLKEEMAQLETNYQERLNEALAKKEESDILLNNKIEQLQTLNEQLDDTKETATTNALAKTEITNELKNLQQELVTAFGKIEEMDKLAKIQKQEIDALSLQLEETKQTVTAVDSQKSILMEEVINYKNALVNALMNYENEQKRAATLEQKLSSYSTPSEQDQTVPNTNNVEETELRSFMNQDSFEDQATLDAPIQG